MKDGERIESLEWNEKEHRYMIPDRSGNENHLVQPDWRIGLRVTPKMRDHPFFGKWATVVSVEESKDIHGVIFLESADGVRFIAKADDWMTA